MPTLFDFADFEDDTTCPRTSAVSSELELDPELSVALAEWSDNEDETCFDV